METKLCRNCVKTKPVTEFYMACRSLTCYQSYCKDCFKFKNKQKYVPIANPKKPGRKKIQLSPEQLEIIKQHKGTLKALSIKLGIRYETIKYYKRVGKF